MGFGCMDASLNGDVVLTSVWGKSVLEFRQGEKEGRKAVRETTVSSGLRIPEAVLGGVVLIVGKSGDRKGLAVVVFGKRLVETSLAFGLEVRNGKSNVPLGFDSSFADVVTSGSPL